MARPTALALAQDDIAEGGLERGRLDSLIGFHLRMAHVAVWRDFCASLEPVGLTQKQLAVLVLIQANPGISQIDMANAISTDRATMMALVDRLQDRHLVQRRPAPQDRRRQAIFLTPAGEELVSRAQELAEAHEQRLLERFTPAELGLLREMLQRIHSGG